MMTVLTTIRQGALATIRGFNGFYTRYIGVLQTLKSPFSLTRVWVMYQLAYRDTITATVLIGELGLGYRLTRECIEPARQLGYHNMVLWTNQVLTHARRISGKAGFTLLIAQPHQYFGEDLIGETRELDLRTSS